MTEQEIQAFVTVCEEKNISNAAKKLYISQSSLSIKLNILEKEIGCKLLVRNRGTREVGLTQEGKRFYEMACQYMKLVENMYAIGRSKAKQTVKVASLNSIGTYLMADVYEAFMNKMPDVIVEVQDMESIAAYQSVEHGLTDLAFVTVVKNIKRLQETPFFSEKMVVVMPDSLSFTSQKLQMKNLDVRNEIYINWSDEFVAWHDTFFGTILQPQIRLELMSQLQHFIKKKDAWAIVPATVAQGLAKQENIVIFEPDCAVPERITYFITRETDNDFMHQFVDLAREVLQKREGIHMLFAK